MNCLSYLMRDSGFRRAFQWTLPATVSILAIAGPVLAQTTLDSASVSAPADSVASPPKLYIVKSSKAGGFVITITNAGIEAITGAVVIDKIGRGLPCPAENVVSVVGSGAPGGSFTLAVLISSGIQLNTLSADQTVTLSYSCEAS